MSVTQIHLARGVPRLFEGQAASLPQVTDSTGAFLLHQRRDLERVAGRKAGVIVING
jgi:hypothetical protein